MKPEILEKKIVEISKILVDNIKKHPGLYGKVQIIISVKDGGILDDFEVIINQKRKFKSLAN
jgi:hypothetical protein